MRTNVVRLFGVLAIAGIVGAVAGPLVAATASSLLAFLTDRGGDEVAALGRARFASVLIQDNL